MLNKILKWLKYIILTILILLIVIILMIRTPYVQNKIKQYAISYVQDKTGAAVQLDYIYIGFNGNIYLENLNISTPKNQKLISLKELELGINIRKLLQAEYHISKININDLNANILIDESGTANYQFLIDAFAGQDTVTKEAPSAPLNLSVDHVRITESSVRYTDLFSGIDAYVKLQHLQIKPRLLDIDQMQFDLGTILLDNSNISAVLFAGSNTDKLVEETAPPSLNLAWKTLNISNTSVHYSDKNTETIITTFLSHLGISDLDLDLSGNSLELSEINLRNSFIRYEYPDAPVAASENTVDSSGTTSDLKTGWNIRIPDISLHGNDIIYKKSNVSGLHGKFDTDHIELCSSNLILSDLIVSDEQTGTSIKSLNFSERSGFRLNDLTLDFSLTPEQIIVRNGHFSTPNSKGSIHADIQGSVSELEKLSFGKNEINISLGLRDLKYFNESEIPQPLSSKPINAKLAFTGSTQKTDITALSVSQSGLYTVNINGTILNTYDYSNAVVNLNFHKSLLYTNLITPFLPESGDSTIHWGEIPAYTMLNGNVNGSMGHLKTEILLINDLFQVKTFIDTRISEEIYKGYIHLNAKDIDRISSLQIPDAIKIRAAFEGRSFNPETLELDLEMYIDTLEYMEYTYSPIKLKGYVEDQIARLDITSEDPNLTFHLQTGIHYKENISINGNLKRFYLDPYKMNLYEQPLTVSAGIPFSVTVLDSSQYDIIARINNMTIENDSTAVTIDHISINYSDIGNNTRIGIESEPFELKLESNSNTEKTIQSVITSIKSYFVPVDSTDTERDAMVNIKSRIYPHSIFNDILLPNSSFTPISFDFNLNQQENILTIDLSSDEIEYGDIKINALDLSVDGLENTLDYNFRINTLSYSEYTLYQPRITGALEDGVLTSTFRNLDRNQKIQNNITILSEKDENYGIFRFAPDDLTILYKKWTAHPENRLVYGRDYIRSDHFEINHYNSAIGIIAGNSPSNNDIRLTLSNFDLSHWTEEIPVDSIGVSGILNADIHVDGIFDKPIPKAMISIDRFIFEDYQWGDIFVNLDTDKDSYKTLVTVKGENDVEIKGIINTSPLYIDQNIRLKQADMAFISYLAEDYISNVRGMINGELNFKGNTEDYDLNGKLTLKDFRFTPNALGISMRLKEEHITFSENNIQFSRFTILDSLGNSSVLNGKINIEDYTNPVFDLSLTAGNFKILDKAGSRGDLYYGTAVINADTKITGNLNNPKVDANLTVLGSTNVTMNIPEDNINIIDRESIVIFMDSASIRMREENLSSSPSITWEYGGIDLTAIITTEEEARFRVILDPVTGDYLDIQGRSNLVFDVTQLGEMTLTGRFDVLSGVYQLSMYDVIRRRFDILPGGYVSWSGDIFNPDIRITAQHRVSTNATGLLANQFSESDNSAYRQEIPFLVNLNIGGNMTSPDISFQLDLPDESKSVHNGAVYSRLQQINTEENEVNTQAFALLTLGQFITGAPTVNSGGSEALIRSSASRILTQQLNQMAGKYIKGVDFNFDVQSFQDYSTGNEAGRTQLNLEVRKKFMEDRLIVQVGSNFNLEGDAYEQQNSSDIIGDIVAEYLISPDGKYRLKAFRQNKFEGMIDGQIISTGISFVFTKETEDKKTKRKREVLMGSIKEEEDADINK